MKVYNTGPESRPSLGQGTENRLVKGLVGETLGNLRGVGRTTLKPGCWDGGSGGGGGV